MSLNEVQLYTHKVEKFIEGTTTQTQERFISYDMEFPQLMICMQIGYKTDVLTEMELSKNFLNTLEPRHWNEKNFDFDVQGVWDNGTYSENDIKLNWIAMQGNQ